MIRLLLPEPDRTVSVHVALDAETAAQLRIARVLEALPDVRVVDDRKGAHLFISTVWTRPPPGSVELRVSAPGDERDAWIGPFLLERRRVLGGRGGRPVLDGLSLEGVVWSAGRGELDGLALSFALPRLAAPILARVDGQASLGEIHASLQALDSGLDWDRFKAQFDRLYVVFNGLNHLLLRHATATDVPATHCK